MCSLQVSTELGGFLKHGSEGSMPFAPTECHIWRSLDTASDAARLWSWAKRFGTIVLPAGAPPRACLYPENMCEGSALQGGPMSQLHWIRLQPEERQEGGRRWCVRVLGTAFR